MKIVAGALITLALAGTATAKDILRVGGAGAGRAETSGDAQLRTGGRRQLMITPTATGVATARSGRYGVYCRGGGYRSGTFVRTVRIALTGVAATCTVTVAFEASVPDWALGDTTPVAVRVVVALR